LKTMTTTLPLESHEDRSLFLENERKLAVLTEIGLWN
jgi:hypothetical protein